MSKHTTENDAGYWDCTPDCERAYGGVHHGCIYVRQTLPHRKSKP